MSGLETVYAIHNFEAENQDEIAFSIGEPIVVLQKDEGYNDGWWQGRNARGHIGLFPMNYTTTQPSTNLSLERKINSLENAISRIQPSSSFPSSSQLPTPSTSSSTRKSNRLVRDLSSSSLNSESYPPPPPQRAAANSRLPTSPTSKNMQKVLVSALAHPTLRNTTPEDWDVDQVGAWLVAMGFENIADNFKAQEISGDILLELNLDSLKELNIDTFGKRFKIHSAINALRAEMGFTPETKARYPDDDDLASPTTHDFGSIQSEASHSRRSSRLPSVDSAMSSPTSATFEKAPPKNAIGRKNIPPHLASSSISPYAAQGKRQTYALPTAAGKDPASGSRPRHDLARNSFSPTSKLQTVLPVAPRNSVDSIVSRPDVTPDMEGWLHKQGDKYKTWNKRWFVLKGPNLFYFKSPTDVRMKGIINLRNYRIICDESIYAGKYCFKAQHERERTFFFYTEVESALKAWTKALMKATIARDFTAPVLSSSTIPTVSLDMARRMKPRPPSMILYRKENRPQSPSSASIAYSDDPSYEPTYEPTSPISSRQGTQFFQGSGSSVYDPLSQSITSFSLATSKQELQDSGFDSTHGGLSTSVQIIPSSPPATTYDEEEEDDQFEHEGINNDYDDEEPIDPQHGDVLTTNRPGGLRRLTEESHQSLDPNTWRACDYVDWINRVVDQSKVSELKDLRSGDTLLELLGALSGKEVRRPPISSNGAASMHMLDKIVAAFKFMGREGVEVDGQYTIKDVFGGNEAKIMDMLYAIRVWSNTFHDEKKASGGTFGESEQERLKALDDEPISVS
ncbi:hypothetical protein BCR43DRAFT_465682 [Syncephalastrum racemosum]|uniref:Uncharacterized protein n=1 Tax=Syncephalastrum racemosum TaxID=13706 RepID=A0A1X2HSK5_SYNRA|nr:hypothetical protein BCR43DRAFT_465682 [Syncephalastrum racemosum]